MSPRHRTRECRPWPIVNALLVVLGTLFAPGSLLAQSPSATLTGTVVDRTGAVVPSAQLVLSNQDTSAVHRTQSGEDGAFVVTTLSPGKYTLTTVMLGFASTEMRDLVLNVGDRARVRVVLEVAPIGETATVVADARRISESPAVGTVVDRKFVENMPLNGRSLHALFELTPGVVITTGGSGLSVNGQRPTANYFTIDGVSANAGVTGGASSFPGQAASGQALAVTALGTTNGVVSVDALQEYRMETSTYAPEFGRTPGGQISLVTRSGGNAFHGTVFDYFRHDALDARDWLMNTNGLKKPRLRQHNYGGVLGGPIVRSQTFFFGSYEGLRLEQPQAKTVDVPSLSIRAAATPAYRRYLDAFPLPNGPDRGTGAAVFSASWSDTSRIDSTSVRVDHNARQGLRLFGRVNYAPTYTSARVLALSTIQTQHRDSASTTVGATWTISPRLVHDVRANYTNGGAPLSARVDDFGGAVPAGDEFFEANRRPDDTLFMFGISGVNGWNIGTGTNYKQAQWNIVDSLTYVTQSHELKTGIDYRRLAPTLGERRAGLQSMSAQLSNLTTNVLRSYLASTFGPEPVVAIFDNLSLYVQDVWRLRSRLTLTYGIRWEVVPPPKGKDGRTPVTVENLDNPYENQMLLAPIGTPLWRTRYNNIAPRLGASYVLSQMAGREFVVRGGFGVFHDLGYGLVANAFATYPLRLQRNAVNVPFPLTPAQTAEPVPDVDPPASLFVADPNLKIPFTYQWNVSAEQSAGAYQTLTLSYVGARGRDLLKTSRYSIVFPEWPTAIAANVSAARNTGYSDYDALQMQYQRRMHRGLQAIVSYTFGRSRDTESLEETGTASEIIGPDMSYGASDFDIRHVLSAAATWQIPAMRGPRWVRAMTRDWGSDLMLRSRSGSPVGVRTPIIISREVVNVRPDIVEGQPFWLDDRTAPGGRRLNAKAFSIPLNGTSGNLQRGVVRGFAAKQIDLALRREFPLSSGVRLQLRAEMFNVLNTPMYANPSGAVATDATGQTVVANNGVSTAPLNMALTGVNSLYQIGGARSSQIALKLLF